MLQYVEPLRPHMLNLLEAFTVKAYLEKNWDSHGAHGTVMFFWNAEAQEQQLIIEQQAQSHGFD